MSKVEFTVPEGWIKGDRLTVSKFRDVFFLRPDIDFSAKRVTPSTELYFHSQFEMLMFLSWWFA